MPQFFIDREIEEGLEVDIGGGDAKHISRVLRLRPGDWLVLSDGRGRSFRTTITKSQTTFVHVLIGAEIRRKMAAAPPALAIATIKRESFEWAIQKAVELGCTRIIPFESSRTIAQDRDLDRRLERWRRIATEAAKQSGLPHRPQVDKITRLEDLFAAGNPFRHIILFYEGEDRGGIHSLFQKGAPISGPTLLIIGPEGGFTQEEIGLARGAGAIVVGLGPQILRVETAAIAAITIWQYELGNME